MFLAPPGARAPALLTPRKLAAAPSTRYALRPETGGRGANACERLGLPIERAQAGAGPGVAPFSVRIFAADAPDTGEGRIFRAAVADLARTLGRDFAPIAHLIASSNSPADALAHFQAYCTEYGPTFAASIIEEVQLAFTANAAASFSA